MPLASRPRSGRRRTNNGVSVLSVLPVFVLQIFDVAGLRCANPTYTFLIEIFIINRGKQGTDDDLRSHLDWKSKTLTLSHGLSPIFLPVFLFLSSQRNLDEPGAFVMISKGPPHFPQQFL